MKQVYIILFGVILIGLTANSSFNNDDSQKVKGVCWVAYDSIVTSNFNVLNNNYVEWISITPFFYQNGAESPEVDIDNSRANWSERDEGIIGTSLLAKEKGLKTMLKPHIWITNANGKWRSDLKMKSEKDWRQWFDVYSAGILHYAKVAEEGEIAALCIGTELYHPTTMFPQKWRTLIKNIRKYYSGELTYAANFYKEYKEIEFWDDLDYIGIQAYFPIAKNECPNVEELKKNWNGHKRSLKKLSKKFNKKIVFTEVGYKNTADAAVEPWIWPRNIDKGTEVSDDVQADCYEAMFSALWNESWFGGLFIWKWFGGNYKFTYEERVERRKQRLKERGHNVSDRPSVGFTPQNKKAELVMRKWFSL